MKDNVWSFHYQYRNVNPFMESFRDEKFTTRHKRHNPIPHSWLSSCGKIEIPHSRLRRSWGISISPRLLSHSWGIGISLLWLVVNFQFLHLRLRRSCRNYPVPETFHKWIGSFPFQKSKMKYNKTKEAFSLFQELYKFFKIYGLSIEVIKMIWNQFLAYTL